MLSTAKSLWSVLRLYQLAVVVATLLYYLFLAEIDAAFVAIAKKQQLANYKVAIVRGEIDNVIAKRECKIKNCNYIYDKDASCFEIDWDTLQNCPLDMILCSDIEKQEYNNGQCCYKDIYDKQCKYSCHYVDTVQYRLRYSDKFIPATLAETWQNETGVKNFTRTGGYMYEVRQFVARLHQSIEGPVEVYFPLAAGINNQPLWDLPPLNIGYLAGLVRIGMFILVVISAGVFFVWAKHFCGFTARRTQKIFATSNSDNHIELHIT